LVFDPGEHLIAIDLWHHDIKQDDIEGGWLQACNGFFAIVRAFETGVAFGREIGVNV
jgi:hypothetical protein